MKITENETKTSHSIMGPNHCIVSHPCNFGMSQGPLTPGGLGDLVQTQLSVPQQQQQQQNPQSSLSSRLQCVEVVRMADGKHFLCMGSDAQVRTRCEDRVWIHLLALAGALSQTPLSPIAGPSHPRISCSYPSDLNALHQGVNIHRWVAWDMQICYSPWGANEDAWDSCPQMGYVGCPFHDAYLCTRG